MSGDDDARGEVLLALARAALEERLLNREPAAPPAAGWLDLPGAVFVTLQVEGDLRGCIGSLEATRPLGEDVATNAVAAALRDPRFPPVTAAELPGVRIEVSLLEPAEPLPAASEAEALETIRPGIDGLILEHPAGRGTFLPQVWDQLPEPASFLRQLKRKAGLPADGWDESYRLSRYRVAKWKETEADSMSAPSPNHPARWWHALDDGRIQCDLCPRDCRLHEGQRGLCFVRQRVGDEMQLTTYGRSSGFCVDPIEKKPLNHFFPGSSVLSFGTAGCNLACKFCQNWDISKSREIDTLADQASPQTIAKAAEQLGCRSVAFTYNDPVIFAEYAMDVADACRERGIATVAVTAGYIHEAPRAEFFAKMDAANVDLKAFTEDFYFKLSAAHLAPVLDTIRYLVSETDCWTELTTLLIPGHNDSDEEIERECAWVLNELGPDVPLHFTAFHPDFKMRDLPATPPATLSRARALALKAGLSHVYTGNVHDADGDTTRCSACSAVLIVRDWYEIREYRLTDEGACPDCGTPPAGRFEAFRGAFGSRRLPVRLADFAG